MGMLTCYCHQAGCSQAVCKHCLHYLGDIEKGGKKRFVYFLISGSQLSCLDVLCIICLSVCVCTCACVVSHLECFVDKAVSKLVLERQRINGTQLIMYRQTLQDPLPLSVSRTHTHFSFSVPARFFALQIRNTRCLKKEQEGGGKAKSNTRRQIKV